MRKIIAIIIVYCMASAGNNLVVFMGDMTRTFSRSQKMSSHMALYTIFTRPYI